jgi:hypothetical protein
MNASTWLRDVGTCLENTKGAWRRPKESADEPMVKNPDYIMGRGREANQHLR